MSENTVTIWRAFVLEADDCERCGEHLIPREARFSFDIGGGAAALCVGCARAMLAQGAAVLEPASAQATR